MNAQKKKLLLVMFSGLALALLLAPMSAAQTPAQTVRAVQAAGAKTTAAVDTECQKMRLEAKSAGPAPAALVQRCGGRVRGAAVTSKTPTPLLVDRGPILAEEAGGDQMTTTSVPGIAVLTPFGALGTGSTDFPGDVVILPGDVMHAYLLSNNGVVTRMDTAGVSVTLPSIPPPTGQGWTDMALDPITGVVYASASVCGTSSALYTVNLIAGTSTLIGTITGSTCVVGIACDNAGNLYGHDIVSDSLLSINKVTGAGTVVGPVGFDGNYGQSMDCDHSTGICYLFAFNYTTFLPELRSVNLATGATTFLGNIGSTTPGGAPQVAGAVFGTLHSSCATDPDCSDGNLCNGVETCVDQVCTPGTPVDCNDNLFCTLDFCDPPTGLCTHQPNPCSDNDPCTVDTCHEDTDTCSHESVCLHVCNTGAVTINDATSATPYPSTITVAGAGAMANLSSVQLECLSHTWPADIDMLLVGPLGQNAIIMSDVGSSYDLVCVNLTLTDSAANPLPISSQITSGTYQPTNSGTGDTFPAPAPTPSGGSALSVFNGLNPNGNWSLYIVDDAGGDSGTMAQGWCLNIAVLSCSSNADCNDNNPCTDDFCVDTQCTHTFNTNPCDDGNACTLGDVCANGVCGAGAPKDCDDQDACTTDTCNTQTGDCGHTPVVCNDNLPCTDNLCNPLSGCYYPPNNNLPCTDNNLCTADACVDGVCVSTPSVDCSNAPLCNLGACNPATGQCEYTPTPGIACTDNDLCTTNEVCVCASGASLAENFDNVAPPALPNGWTTELVTGLPGDIAWATTAALFDSPPNSAYTDDPSHVTDKVLVSPAFVAIGGATLTFRTQHDLESGYDGAVLEIKIGAGAWQDIITAGGVWVSGGYNATISTCCSNPLAGRPGWSGISGGGAAPIWITSSVTMPAGVTGQTVQLRWRVGTDSSVSHTGQWIDSIDIPVCNIGCVGTAITCPPEGQCQYPGKCDSLTGECTYPPKPDGATCDDGNPCTAPDTCVNGSCGGPHVNPTEVNNTVLVLGGGGGAGGTISWTDAPGPYNVYRGSRTAVWVYNHTCFDPNTPGPTVDPNAPSPGEVFYYLVSRKNACGESIVGRDSNNGAEPNTSPCM